MFPQMLMHNAKDCISLDCKSFVKDNTPPFIMVVLLLYTDVILTHNLMGDMFNPYTCLWVLCSTLSSYFLISINILQQFTINALIFISKIQYKLFWLIIAFF